jgi:hypothetical protein
VQGTLATKTFFKIEVWTRIGSFQYPQKKNRSLRHKLRAVVNDTALAIGGDPAEYAFDPHPDLCFAWVADNLGGHLGAFIELDDGEHIWPAGGELVGCSLDDRERDYRPLPGKLVVNDLSFPAAIGTEGPRGEEVAVTGLALCSDQVVTLGDLSPESCNGHF